MKRLSVVELCRVGVHGLERMARRGDLAPEHVWVALAGVKRYRRAVKRGDVCSEGDQAGRLAECAACCHCTEHPLESFDATAHYCGEPFRDEGDGRPCGCLVGLTIGGVTYPAGRLVVASMGCPLEEPRFGAARPAQQL